MQNSQGELVETNKEMADESNKKHTVCVTGAGGYIASWLTKLLLSRGFTVHGTARDPDDKNNEHLRKLEGAAESLKLFTVDLLDYNSVSAAIEGCDGVFHVASPVMINPVNPEVDLIAPSITGTQNVLRACSEANVKRLVVVSSICALYTTPNLPKDQVNDETCWSDKDFCRKNNYWYDYCKTVAESEALQYGEKTGLDVVTICPALVFGPMLQATKNLSSSMLLEYFEGKDAVENKLWSIVDVRDVAESLILTYEKPEAKGRYICSAHSVKGQEVVEILKKLYPCYNYQKSFTPQNNDVRLSSKKLQSLGWKYRPLESTLVDSVERYKQLGLLD